MAGLIDKGKTELIGGGSIARLRSTRVSHATMSCTDMPGLQRIAQAIHLILGVDVDQNGVGVAQMVSRALHQLEHHQSDFDGFWQQQAGPDVERVVAPNPYKSLQNLVFEWMVQLPARLVDSPTAQLLAEALLLAPPGAAQQILKDKLSINKHRLLTMMLQHWARVVHCHNQIDVHSVATYVVDAVFAAAENPIDLVPVLVLLITESSSEAMSERECARYQCGHCDSMLDKLAAQKEAAVRAAKPNPSRNEIKELQPEVAGIKQEMAELRDCVTTNVAQFQQMLQAQIDPPPPPNDPQQTLDTQTAGLSALQRLSAENQDLKNNYAQLCEKLHSALDQLSAAETVCPTAHECSCEPAATERGRHSWFGSRAQGTESAEKVPKTSAQVATSLLMLLAAASRSYANTSWFTCFWCTIVGES